MSWPEWITRLPQRENVVYVIPTADVVVDADGPF